MNETEECTKTVTITQDSFDSLSLRVDQAERERTHLKTEMLRKDAEIARVTEDRDCVSAATEACHKLIDTYQDQDPETSSLECLEDRVKGLIDSIRLAAEVQTESNASYCKALTDLDEATVVANGHRRALERMIIERDQLRATLATLRKTVEEWKTEAEQNRSGLLDAAQIEMLTLNKVLAMLDGVK